MIFEEIFKHSMVGTLIFDQHGKVERCNLLAVRLFGYKNEQLVGRPIEALFQCVPKDLFSEDPKRCDTNSSFKLKAKKNCGELFLTDVRRTRLESDGDIRVVLYLKNINNEMQAEQKYKNTIQKLKTKIDERSKEFSDALIELNLSNENLLNEMEYRKEAEKQIRLSLARQRELNQLKSRFASMASHEFRTPLGGILTSASLIARYNEQEDERKRAKHVHIIKKSVKNLTNILNEFLSLDRLDQGIIKLHVSSFSLTLLIGDIIDSLHSFSENHPEIVMKHHNKNLIIYQDQEIVRNIILNLLSNAIKYSPKGKTIIFESYTVGERLFLKVEDQGIGVPLSNQKHLFERFYRAENVNTVQGTGLGLNIVKSYLDLIDGEIKFQSEENVGTTFTVDIPLKLEIKK